MLFSFQSRIINHSTYGIFQLDPRFRLEYPEKLLILRYALALTLQLQSLLCISSVLLTL